MPKKLLSENPETLDYVLSLLKENSEDLNTLLKEVGKIGDRVSDICELSSFKRVEEKLNSLQNEVKTLIDSSRKQPLESQVSPHVTETKGHQGIASDSLKPSNPLIVMDCEDWKDFQEFAAKAQTVYFSYQDSNKTFEAEALKDNEIMAYDGEIPMLALLLKLWLNGQLEIPEEKVLKDTVK